MEPTNPAPGNPAMKMGEFSFFFVCTTLAKGLIVVLPSVVPIPISVRAVIAFPLLIILEDLDLFSLGNVETIVINHIKFAMGSVHER
jgi:hypothetical protein